MEGTTIAGKKTARTGLIALVSLALAAMLGLAACGGGGGAAAEVSGEDRTNAKQVIMAAGDLFTMMDMGLTDADSPATISQDDPAYAEFFDKLLQYKKVADLDVQDVSITVCHPGRAGEHGARGQHAGELSLRRYRSEHERERRAGVLQRRQGFFQELSDHSHT